MQIHKNKKYIRINWQTQPKIEIKNTIIQTQFLLVPCETYTYFHYFANSSDYHSYFLFGKLRFPWFHLKRIHYLFFIK